MLPPEAASSTDADHEEKNPPTEESKKKDSLRKGFPSNLPTWKRKLKSIHVTNLPVNVTESELKVLFSPFGLVRDLFIQERREDAKDGFKFTYAFVRYEKIDSCERAINYMNGYKLDENTLTVTLCQNTKTNLDNPSSNMVIQSNLPDEELMDSSEVQREIHQQCRYYNDVYIGNEVQEGHGEGLQPVKYMELMQGVFALESFKAHSFRDQGPRLKLDLNRFERIVAVEKPNRPQYVPQPRISLSDLSLSPSSQDSPVRPPFHHTQLNLRKSIPVRSAPDGSSEDELRQRAAAVERSLRSSILPIIPGRGKVIQSTKPQSGHKSGIGRGAQIEALLASGRGRGVTK